MIIFISAWEMTGRLLGFREVEIDDYLALSEAAKDSICREAVRSIGLPIHVRDVRVMVTTGRIPTRDEVMNRQPDTEQWGVRL